MRSSWVGGLAAFAVLTFAGARTARAYMWQVGTERLEAARVAAAVERPTELEPVVARPLSELGRECISACASHYEAASEGLTACESACEDWSARVRNAQAAHP